MRDAEPVRRAGFPEAVAPTRWQFVGIHGMFFASGLASLICEVVWFKQLQFIIGSSTYSVSVVVACFFGGLALGSWLVGRRADSWRRPLRAYALLEGFLAAASAAVTLALSAWATWVEWLAPWLGPQSTIAQPLIVLISFILLIVPTSLMGATLPVLVKYLVREQTHLARHTGTLYGTNTLGGAAGCFLVGFLLIGWLGVLTSGLLASVIYAAIAGGALLLGRSVPTTAPAPTAESTHQEADAAPPAQTAQSARLLLVSFGLMGFASIAYEVLWFRLLAYFGVHTVYAFSGMLGVYLLGLVLGLFLCARFLAPHKSRHLLYLARAQLLLGGAALMSLAMLGRSRNLLAVLRDAGITDLAAFLLFCLLVLLTPTTLIGICLPLVTELTTQRLSGLGARLGALYSLNTVGGILGSLLTGFVLLPLLGSQWCFLAIVLLNMGLFVMLVGSQPTLRHNRMLWREGMLTGVCLVAGFAWLGSKYLQKSLTAFTGATVLEFKETPDATFVVVQYDSASGDRAQQLLVNGTSYANNAPPGRRYMGTLGHLPALLHPDPKSALVICIGTGTTVGALTLHPEIAEVWAVDIARTVFDVAPHFVPLNNGFHTSPKVRQVAADGRHFLLCTDRQFDVLTFEPPPPQEAGVVNLYSREFYQLAKRRMKPGAILCQWMPMDIDREVLPRMMMATLRAEFPHVSLWIPNRREGVAIASTEPLGIDMEKLRRRMADPRLHADLAAYGLGEPEQLAATFFTANEALVRYIGPPASSPTIVQQSSITALSLKPTRFEHLLPYREPVEKYLVQPPTKPARLKACAEVIGHIWLNFEKTNDRQLTEGRAHVDEALGLDPTNRYLRHLLTRPDE